MTRRTDHRSSCSFMAVCDCYIYIKARKWSDIGIGHTARPTDFCWAPGPGESWTAASTSEDNVVMIWQPTMHVWAGDEVHIEEKQLEADPMEGIESAPGPSRTGGASAAYSESAMDDDN